MYRVPQELSRLLREAGAKSSAMPMICAIAGHWKTPANYERNIAELRKNGGELFHPKEGAAVRRPLIYNYNT